MDDSNTVATGRPTEVPQRRRGGSLVGWLVLLLVVAALAGVSWWVIARREAPEQRAGRFTTAGPMPVAVAAVETGDVRITLNALGTVTPFATVTVKTQISGRLMRVAVAEGQVVNQGDVIAEIDPRPYQAALAQAEGQLQRDQALLRNAELDLQRYRTLVQQDSMARQQRDTQESLVRQYQGIVRSDQALVDTARLNLSYCTIIAPITGRTGLRLVDAGNYVTSSDSTGIVIITQVKPISVVFSVPEDNVQAVMARLRAGGELAVTAFDRSRSTAIARGVLATIDNQIDPATGTVKLKARFANDDESLFPNQFVNVELALDTLRGALTVPTAAVQRGAAGTFVYVVSPESTVSAKTVRLGPQEGQRVSVQGDLQAGSRVVVDGADRLREGASVTIPGGDGAEGQQRPAGAQGEGRRRRPTQ